MSSRAAVLLASALLAGCPSKENQSSSGATSPSGASTSTAGSAATPPPAGPLATLESSPSQEEVWTSQDGQPMPFLYFTREKVRVSAQCKQSSGQLACDAIRQIRGGAPVEVPASALTGGISAGTRACQAIKGQLVTGHDASSNEDGFCRFPDGSMLSTGALEQYGMRVLE